MVDFRVLAAGTPTCFYLGRFLLLIYVEIAGAYRHGRAALDRSRLFQLQPSELMKIALVLVLARYFHGLSYEEIGRPTAADRADRSLVAAPGGAGAEAARPRHGRHAAAWAVPRCSSPPACGCGSSGC